MRTGTLRCESALHVNPFGHFGGVKASGYGKGLGVEGIVSYTVIKSISAATSG